MGSDEDFLELLARALAAVGLESIIVGSMAAALQGAPVTTQDVDILIRDTAANRAKLERLCGTMGLARPVEVSPMSKVVTIIGGRAAIDVLFDQIAGGLSFHGLRTRAVEVQVGPERLTVASLEDVIASKTAAGRPKDLAQLPILRDTLRVKQWLGSS